MDNKSTIFRRRWTAEEKARIVSRYLREHFSLADFSDGTGVSPALIWEYSKTTDKIWKNISLSSDAYPNFLPV